MKPSFPGLLFVMKHYYYYYSWFNFMTSNWSIHIFLFFLVSVLGRGVLLGTYLLIYFLVCPFYWCEIVHSHLDNPLHSLRKLGKQCHEQQQ